VVAGNTSPDIVIVGAMKSATTTLHHYLAQHPQIACSPGKELNFFSHDDLWAKGLDWYLSQFEAPNAGRMLLDSSPNYTKRQHWPLAATRLFETNPHAKIVYLIREPVARMMSAHVHDVAAGRQRRSASETLGDHRGTVMQTTRYFWQLTPYLDVFARDQILVVRFDQLVDSSESTVANILRFLDLEAIGELKIEPERQNASVDKTRPTHLVRMLRFDRARGLLRKLHPRLADRPLEAAEVEPGVAAAVRDYLRPDLVGLQETGLVDVTDWIRDD